MTWSDITLLSTEYNEAATVDYVDDKFINTVFPTPPVGTAYDFNFSATDEVNLITTASEKIRLNAPRTFNVQAIEIGLNTAGGAAFQISVNINGGIFQTVTQGNALISTTVVDSIITADSIISLDVKDIGDGTGTGLKCYLVGVVS